MKKLKYKLYAGKFIPEDGFGLLSEIVSSLVIILLGSFELWTT